MSINYLVLRKRNSDNLLFFCINPSVFKRMNLGNSELDRELSKVNLATIYFHQELNLNFPKKNEFFLKDIINHLNQLLDYL
jgi:hypothetical protein